MSNILAIAQKELKGYFASPIAYVVIGLYAVMFGYFFYALLLYFDRQSMQMAGLGGGGQPVNVNEQLIRPVFLNTTVIFLFILPMVTMRTYSEEKRSGTIELLLTAPLTDFQIIAGKFLGAMGLYAAMLAVTLPHIGLLFWLGNPEWIPIVITYLGLLLMGGCFISVGLLHLEPDQEPDRRGHGDVHGVPDALGDQLDRVIHGPADAGNPELPVDHGSPRRLHAWRRSTRSIWSTTSASSASGCT